jgi:glycerol kinase
MSAKATEHKSVEPGLGSSNQDMLDIISKLQARQKDLEDRLKTVETTAMSGNLSNGNGVQDTSELIGAIDQGTTSSRFLIFNRQGEPIAQHQEEFRQIYPNSG